ncbi:hypothetical protein DACRYDRAFT_105284 [Dacryopinax primogenitus]|uniref:Uncharacterized protein n=1 Tax=Dacryopinax primogenitus (strain DJM 731) TaxID=1858805 RepID=M5GD36_DACPD|nr:uncharacterized protein DACRYDRAFT_105284 [Dacryopinax primogenitus]EJU04222.1 hypothetical protein DACRYDRAFT_105284 [Dacryopinax primogenitus]
MQFGTSLDEKGKERALDVEGEEDISLSMDIVLAGMSAEAMEEGNPDCQVAQMHVRVLRANAALGLSAAFPVAQASTSQPNMMPAAVFHDYPGYAPGAELLPIPSKLGANMTTESMAASLPSEKPLTALDLHADPAFVKKYAEPYRTVVKEHKRSTSLLHKLEEVLLPILGSLAKWLAAAQCPADVVGKPSTLLGTETGDFDMPDLGDLHLADGNRAEDWQKAKEKREREMEKLEKQREKEQAMWDAAPAMGKGVVFDDYPPHISEEALSPAAAIPEQPATPGPAELISTSPPSSPPQIPGPPAASSTEAVKKWTWKEWKAHRKAQKEAQNREHEAKEADVELPHK